MGKAIDEVRYSFVTAREVTAPSWNPGSESVYAPTWTGTIHVTKKPDTIFNKPDEWGFRKMSPWSRTFLEVASPLYHYETRVKPGKSGWFSKPSTCNVIGRTIDTNPDTWYSVLTRLKMSPGTELSCENQAKTKILNTVSQKKWDLGVFALELKETNELVTSLAQDMASVWRKLSKTARSTHFGRTPVGRALTKQRSIFDKTDLPEKFADRWMEYTFGVKPTLYDIHDACQYLDTQRGRALLAYAKAGATREDEAKDQWWQGPYHKAAVIRKSKISIHYAMLYESLTDRVDPLNQLGLDNPYSVAWEKLPYSWMIDYVLDVGGWLQTWTSTSSLKLKAGCVSKIWRGRIEVQDLFLTNPNLEWVSTPRPFLSMRGGEFERRLLSAFPVPAFAPTLKQSVSGFQLANSLFALRNLIHPGIPNR